MATHYDTLGINQTASAQEIKQAYRRLVKVYHPDKNPGRPDVAQKMVLINEAYCVLKDSIKRAEYDSLLSLQAQPESQPSYSHEEAEAPQEIPHYSCEQCGTQDATLRVSIFISVLSIIFVTQKNPHLHILCSKCRIKQSLKTNLGTWFGGWWGFPWGPIYTIEALFKNLMGGEQPVENNASLLSLLAYDFYKQGRYGESYKALQASYRLRADREIKAYMDQMKAYVPQSVVNQKSPLFSSPALFNIPMIFGLAVLSIFAISKLGSNDSYDYSPPTSSPAGGYTYQTPAPQSGPIIRRYPQTERIINIKPSAVSFMMGFKHLSDAMETVKALDTSTRMPIDMSKIQALLRKGKESFGACDIPAMNEVYEGWGDIVTQKFIPAIDHLLIGFGDEPDLENILLGDSEITDINTWWKANAEQLYSELTRRGLIIE